jgi:hypothetical protein
MHLPDECTESKKPNYLEIANILATELQVELKPYYSKNDKAHQWDHVLQVLDNVTYIFYHLDRSPKLAQWASELGEDIVVSFTKTAIAALYHDMFSTENRKEHHELAKAFIIKGDDYLLAIDKAARVHIGQIASEHRASFKDEYSSIECEILAAADRGAPDVDAYIMRSILYAHTKRKYSKLDSLVHGLIHIGQKFGSNKNAKVPDWYDDFYKEQIRRSKGMFELCGNTQFDAEMAIGFVRTYFDLDTKVRQWAEEIVLDGLPW